MSKGKVVLITKEIEPQTWDIFLKHAHPDLDVEIANPDEGESQLIEKVTNSNFLVVYRSGQLSDEVITGAEGLKFIQSTSQGMNHIPVRAANDKGIYVANISGGNAISVAEFAVLLMMAVMRRLVPGVEAFRKGNYQSDLTISHQLYSKTVGLVGLGNIGKHVARILSGFDSSVVVHKQSDESETLAHEYNARQVSLEYLLENSDVVSLHVPLTESTKHLIGWEQLNMMKPQAFLVNTSRGAVVDEAALIRALREKRIAGAGLDVFEQEPAKPENPLLNMENVVATSHIAAVTLDNWEPRVTFIWDNIRRVREGHEPLNMIT